MNFFQLDRLDKPKEAPTSKTCRTSNKLYYIYAYAVVIQHIEED